MAPGLYLVATPIGNARDLTLRAIDVLRGADVIACEDTRVSRKLLTIHDIRTPLFAYHEHNAATARPKIMERLQRGEIVALISDAGTPLINDPGYKLVRACRAAGQHVTAAPGASSVLTALVLSGLPSDRFLYVGFLPTKTAARQTVLTEFIALNATLVVLESPKRLAKSLADMAAVLGPRDACVTRELTKLFEETRPGPLTALADHYAQAGPPKGEVVVVIGPPDAPPALSDAEVDARLRAALAAGDSVRDAVADVTKETAWPRQKVYRRALALTKDG